MHLGNARLHYLSKQNPFSRCSYFADASKDDLHTLTRIRTVHHFNEGQRLPLKIGGHEGFYYIHEGYAKIVQVDSASTETIRIAGSRDLAGYARWHSPFGNYEMETISSMTASFFKKDEFLELQHRSAYIANEVTRWLMDVLTYQEYRIRALKGRTAKARVASTLDILHRRFGSSIGGSNSVVAAPIDRKTLADLSGVAVEVLSRVLTELEKDGVIARDGRIIVIADIRGLEQALRP